MKSALPSAIASRAAGTAPQVRRSLTPSQFGRAEGNAKMSSHIRGAIASCLSGTVLAATLLVGGAPAATVGRSPQGIGPCGPELPPQAHCPPDKVAMCRRWKSVVRGGKTSTCCAIWGCWPKRGRG
jgi:hypothetical protein